MNIAMRYGVESFGGWMRSSPWFIVWKTGTTVCFAQVVQDGGLPKRYLLDLRMFSVCLEGVTNCCYAVSLTRIALNIRLNFLCVGDAVGNEKRVVGLYMSRRCPGCLSVEAVAVSC